MGRKKKRKAERGRMERKAASPEPPARSPLVPLALGGVVLATFLVFDLGVFDQYEGPKTHLLRIGLAGVLVLASLDMLRRGLPSPPVLLRPLLVFLAVLVLSTILSVSPWVSLHGTYESHQGLLAWLAYAGLFVVAALWVRDETAGRRLFRALACAVAALTVSALLYRIGLDFPSLLGYTTIRRGSEAVRATMGNPNALAAVLYTSLPLVAALAFREKDRRVRVALGVLLAAMLAVIAFTGSRTGYLVTLLLVPLALLLSLAARRARPKPVAALPWVVPVLLAGLLGLWVSRDQLPRFVDAIRGPTAALAEFRLPLWSPALRVFRDHPLLGSGPDTYKIAAAPYLGPEVYRVTGAGATPLRAHCEPLNLLATTGLAGTLAWLALLGFAVYYAWKLARLPDEKGGYLARAGLLGMAALFLGNLLNFGIVSTHALEFLFMGVIAGLYSTHVRKRDPRFSAAPEGAHGTIAVAGITISALLFLVCAGSALHWRRADGHYLDGFVAVREGRIDAAARHLGRALDAAPGEPRYLDYMAQVQLSQARQAEGGRRAELAGRAADLFHRALDREPGAPALLAGLCNAQLLQGRGDEALEGITRAVERAPGAPQCRQAKFNILLELERWEEAEAELDTIHAVWGNWERITETDMVRLGRAYVRKGLDDAAQRTLRRAIEMFPENAEPYFGMAAVHARREEREETLRWLGECLQRDPRHELALRMKRIIESQGFDPAPPE